MNYVFISPQFPPNYYNFAVHLKNLGVNVLGLGDEHYSNLREELKNSLTEYYRANINDYSQAIKALGWFTHKYGKIDRLESHNEYWLETDAKLRTDFNISGINNSSIERIKHKSIMKQTFIDAKVSVALGQIIESPAQCEEFISQVGYPVIAKPDIGVGAASTYKIRNKKELDLFFQERPFVTYFMEDFVQGEIVSFDGLTDKDGNIVFASSHEFSNGVMEVVNNDLDIYYYNVREIPYELEQAGKRIVKAFDVKERFFHFEFFRTVNNDLVALEVNMRPPGGLTTDMFNYANNIDIYKEYANIVVNNNFKSDYKTDYFCAYAGRKNNKQYVHSHETILDKLGESLVSHEPINGIFSAALGNYGYIIRTSDLEDLKEKISLVQEKI